MQPMKQYDEPWFPEGCHLYWNQWAFAGRMPRDLSMQCAQPYLKYPSIPVYRSINGTVYKHISYSDPTIILYSQRHIPYMLMEIMFFSVLALFPSSLLLCLYLTRIYRTYSRLISGRKRWVITIFTKTLYSFFKE